LVQELCSEHSGCKADIENLKSSDKKQWDHITTIENALPKLVPVWVTVALTCMGAVTGAAVGIAAMVIKFSGKAGA